MNQSELKKLIKILNLTQSESDGEALSAIRMANKIIDSSGKSWEKLIKIDLIVKKTYPPCPEKFDAGFFALSIETKEFVDTLPQIRRDWINKIIRYYNINRDIPDSHWVSYRNLWQNFIKE